MKRRILVVEDDTSLARLLCDNLAFEGFDVEHAADGAETLQKAAQFGPALVLLDLMLPNLDGFEVCRTLTARFPQLRIIILTARTQKEDKLRGLQIGADDYVTKPFALDELLARVHAVLRRADPTVHHLAFGEVSVDLHLQRAWSKGQDLGLTHREFEVLQYLAERRGHVVTREELLRAVWGYREVPLTRTVDNFIARLRRKIEPDPHHPRFIRTAHGGGYSLTTSTSRTS
jgi:DNA-binding response OmpR family regulator